MWVRRSCTGLLGSPIHPGSLWLPVTASGEVLGPPAGFIRSSRNMRSVPESFIVHPAKQRVIMDTAALYNTFTHPKVVTSMLLAGIGLGLLLSGLRFFFQGTWFLPAGFAAVILGTVIIYMVWLDRQEFRMDEVVSPDKSVAVPAGKGVLIRAERPVDTDIRSGSPLFSDTRVIISMLALAIGLGFAVCVVVILFRGTWFLPALITALTIGTVTIYLCWLDGLGPRNR